MQVNPISSTILYNQVQHTNRIQQNNLVPNQINNTNNKNPLASVELLESEISRKRSTDLANQLGIIVDVRV